MIETTQNLQWINSADSPCESCSNTVCLNNDCRMCPAWEAWFTKRWTAIREDVKATDYYMRVIMDADEADVDYRD